MTTHPPRPRRLRIGHMIFDVRWSKRAVQSVLPPGDEAGGAMSESHALIAVEPLHNREQERAIMLHEVLHACFAASGYELTEKAEEAVVLSLQGPLLDSLRSNPTFVRYLTE